MSGKHTNTVGWVVVVLCLASLVAAALTRQRQVLAKPTSAFVTLAEVRSVNSQKERLGYEVVTITRFGFEPSEITRQGGRFFLAVENRSALRNITIRIDPEYGNRVREVTQPADQMNWVDEMNLPPGRYRISTADKPERFCQLTITAN